MRPLLVVIPIAIAGPLLFGGGRRDSPKPEGVEPERPDEAILMTFYVKLPMVRCWGPRTCCDGPYPGVPSVLVGADRVWVGHHPMYEPETTTEIERDDDADDRLESRLRDIAAVERDYWISRGFRDDAARLGLEFALTDDSVYSDLLAAIDIGRASGFSRFQIIPPAYPGNIRWDEQEEWERWERWEAEVQD